MRWIPLAAVTLAAAMAFTAARAQHEHEDPPPAVAGGYAPRLGELMILQQIRHSKLWFAVAANNWELADHGLAELKAGFANIVKIYPTAYGVSFEPVITALNQNELTDLGKAIETQDRVKFTIAFDQLTAACNACHQVSNHAFIVIQQPISPPFNNQSFAPPGGQSPPPGGGHPH
jgi:hypothetical protein